MTLLEKLGLAIAEKIAKKEGEPLLVGVFQKVHEKNPALYSQVIPILSIFLAEANEITSTTPSKIDDELVKIFSEVVATSAAANGITL